jgi:hypothetical protein
MWRLCTGGRSTTYVFKAPVLSERDMVYYEGYRVDAVSGVAVNVSSDGGAAGDEIATCVPLPAGRVRSRLHLHYKRFEPVPEGVRYTTIQQVAIGMSERGWVL